MHDEAAGLDRREARRGSCPHPVRGLERLEYEAPPAVAAPAAAATSARAPPSRPADRGNGAQATSAHPAPQRRWRRPLASKTRPADRLIFEAAVWSFDSRATTLAAGGAEGSDIRVFAPVPRIPEKLSTVAWPPSTAQSTHYPQAYPQLVHSLSSAFPKPLRRLHRPFPQPCPAPAGLAAPSQMRARFPNKSKVGVERR